MIDESPPINRRRKQLPLRVYLDAQQWNYLVDESTAQGGPSPRDLRRAVAGGVIEIVGSIDLWQELILTPQRERSKADSMLDLFETLVGNRVLRPLEERAVLEVRQGGLLPTRRSIANAVDRRAMKAVRQSTNAEDLRVLLHSERDLFVADERGARSIVLEDLGSASVPVNRSTLRSWFEQADIADWVESVVRGGASRGLYELPEHGEFSYRRFPSVWMFTAIRMARIVQVIGDGRRIRPSDMADFQHVSYSPYFDVLVSDDHALLEAIAMLNVHHMQALVSTDFAGVLDRLETSNRS